MKKVLILGVNGFIGHHLTKRILATTDWQVFGMDMFDDKVREFADHPRFNFFEGDITINKEWVEYHVRKCDVILGPTYPTTAFRLGEKIGDPVQMYLSDIYTVAVNLAGLPGLSLPCGEVSGLPTGLQLIGNYFDEARLLNAAHRYQQTTDWHLRRPSGPFGLA